MSLYEEDIEDNQDASEKSFLHLHLKTILIAVGISVVIVILVLGAFYHVVGKNREAILKTRNSRGRSQINLNRQYRVNHMSDGDEDFKSQEEEEEDQSDNVIMFMNSAPYLISKPIFFYFDHKVLSVDPLDP